MPTIANVEMAAAWDGHEGDHWTEQADRYEVAGRRLWQRLVARDFVAGADRVLDIGCGTGRSTREVARLAASGSALGVDLSARMLAEARRRSDAEGVANIGFEQGDAQVHPFETGRFDVAISAFGAMFFADPVAAFANIGSAVRPGGRLALLAWREPARNEWVSALRAALACGRDLPEPPVDSPGPFGLAGAARVRSTLGSAGFDQVDLEPVDEPLEFGEDADDAFSFVGSVGIVEGLTRDLDDATRAAALDRVRAMLAAHETAEGVLLDASAWLISARRA